jgi:glycine/D-amino acid oxidase-like deaminating enzyme
MVHSHFEQEPTNRPSSLWLDQALDAPSTACPRLTQNINADVAIIGGGYVGLWTAIELKSRRPDFSIAILESDICGSGASGRNGGYVLSWWTKAPSLLAMWGADTARDLILKSEAAITLLDDFCKQ